MNYFTNGNIDFWIEKNLNVLLRGKHGVGKTARILEAFNRHNLKWQYFSAATMDPWVDFIGVPKERTGPDGKAYLDLVRPKVWQDDEVEAVFLDEFNRASKKVRNAVMELIQFKSINGKKFKNLRIVWAAINPEDEEVNKYDVETLDPAQMDRFHVILNVPYQPDADFFRTKYGRESGDVALAWWKDLKTEEKELVSPRRLDYIMDLFNKGGQIQPLVHQSINVLPLLQQLKNGPISKQVDALFEKKDVPEARRFLFSENSYHGAIQHILKKKDLIEFFIPLLNTEKINTLMTQHVPVKTYVLSNYPIFKDLIHSIAASKAGQLSSACQSVIMQNVKVQDMIGTNVKWKNSSDEKTFANKLQALKSIQQDTTANRENVYSTVRDFLPEEMAVSTAAESLRLLEQTLIRSEKTTIVTKMDKLPVMVNHIIGILDRHGFKWEGVVDAKLVVDKINQVTTYIKEQQKLNDNAQVPF